jgi:hypothetical protein
MGLIRRLALSVGVVVSLVATLAIASVGAAGGFGQGPGHFNIDDTNASISFFDPTTNLNGNVSADRTMFFFRPKGGGAPQLRNATVLSVFVSIPSVDPTVPPTIASACFFIPDSGFVVSADLQHASLDATVNETDFCKGLLQPALGAAGSKDAGSGGGGFGFTFPLHVTASWTGTGLVGVQKSEGRFTCGGFASNTHSTNQNALSSASTTTISGFGTFGGTPFTFANVFVNHTVMDVHGTGIIPAGCAGGGKGG